MRTAEQMAAVIDRSVGGAAAHAFTGIARFAQARGIGIDEAQRIFGVQIDRLAKIMDSAITLPIIGRVGLDAVLDLIPVFGNFAGAAVSLTLIARTLQYGPPPSLVSKMLSNVLVDVILGAIPVSARSPTSGSRPTTKCGADARIPRAADDLRFGLSGSGSIDDLRST